MVFFITGLLSYTFFVVVYYLLELRKTIKDLKNKIKELEHINDNYQYALDMMEEEKNELEDEVYKLHHKNNSSLNYVHLN